MNSSALLSLYRSLTRHKLYAALNIGGLAVGIAVFLILGLYVRFETSYEKWLPDHDKIYIVQEYWDQPGSPANGYSNSTMGGLIDQLREDFPDVVGTRIQSMDANVIRDGTGTTEPFAYADPNLFDILALPMRRGDGRLALRDPANVLLNETLARKYFPGTDAIGRMLTLTIMGKTMTYRIGGVFRDLPKATELQFAILGRMPTVPSDPMWNHWGSERVQTFLRFASHEDAKRFTTRMPAFVKRRGTKDQGVGIEKMLSLPATPVANLHLQAPSRMLRVTTLGLVGLLTLLIAIVNYVNLATARAGLRAREVAMRKVLGASRATLILQFLGEAVLTVALATLAGLILAELGLPLVNAAGGLALAIPYALVIPALILLALSVGVVAGLYPAVIISRFPAAAVLASARSPGGGRAGTRVRETLVVFQFALAIAFMIGTAVLVAQTRHVRSTDVGFKRDGLVIISSTSDSALDKTQVTSFLEQVRRLPGVRSVTTSDSTPGSSSGNSNNVQIPGRPGSGPTLQWIRIGPDFFPTFGFRLLAGRLPDAAHRLDDNRDTKNSDPVNIVVNRSAARQLGFTRPDAAIGKTVGVGAPRTIIGVVDDARFFSPRDPINGTVYYFYSEQSGDPRTTLRIDGDPRAMIDKVRLIWKQVAPQVPFDAKTAARNLQDYYDADDRMARLFAIGAGLAVLIGCVGLWGLASFNTARRIKEIGIRKTLGASAADIVKLLVGQFLRPVLLANLIAWPLAFVAMRTWLAGFDDRIALSPVYFVGASLLALTIAVLTVLGQSLRASRAAPAWALRHE